MDLSFIVYFPLSNLKLYLILVFVMFFYLSAAIPGLDPGEPSGICTKTFANSTYPGPIFFHKKATTVPPPGA